MSGALLNEHEVMLNVGLGAQALTAYAAAFHAAREERDQAVTLWHVTTVLPLVFNGASRRAISKRRVSSGLRSILTRDLDNDLAQNEAIFDLTGRLRATYERTMRSLNCAIAWGLLGIEDGEIVPLAATGHPSFAGEAREIVKAAEKLGTWAGQLSSFEYFTILGMGFHQ